MNIDTVKSAIAVEKQRIQREKMRIEKMEKYVSENESAIGDERTKSLLSEARADYDVVRRREEFISALEA